ncbi:MAG TPA: DUF2892 domain-containing protein [bacterium]|nr:DUF2892 domain-containing protein [bacterium]HPN35156.1 DUF2892 domain-containing protein [bacterium]
MTKNIGTTDRTIRIVLGLIILVMGVIFKSYFGLLGLLLIATGLLRWCPAYLPFGLNTCRTKPQ